MMRVNSWQIALKSLNFLWIGLVFQLIASCNSEHSSNENISSDSVVVRVDSLIWHWDSEFSFDEKLKLSEWIDCVFTATEQNLGDYEFDVHVHFERSDQSKRPVPFGLATRKDGINMVRLYVNPLFSLKELLADWTAPHELSHLSIPFLGKSNKWFSEGFATYLSRKTLVRMGCLTNEEFDSMYTAKIVDSKKYYNSTTKTFVEVSDSLLSNYKYGSIYWGSSSYFMILDKKLKSNGKMSFMDVLKEYQRCCRLEDEFLLEVIKSFDDIIGDPICQELMVQYRTEPSFEVMKEF